MTTLVVLVDSWICARGVEGACPEALGVASGLEKSNEEWVSDVGVLSSALLLPEAVVTGSEGTGCARLYDSRLFFPIKT